MASGSASLDGAQVGADAIRLIRARCSEPLTVTEVAAEFCVSRRQLQRALSSQGTTFQVERLTARMKLGAALLVEGMEVGFAARLCGYANASHFCVAISRAYGVTPTKLRIAGRLNRRLPWRAERDRTNPAKVRSTEYYRRRRRWREDADALEQIAGEMLPSGRELVGVGLSLIQGKRRNGS